MYRIISSLTDEESYKKDINFLFEIIDSKLNNIIAKINTSVYDYTSAVKAKEFYNKDWFVHQLLSVDSKIKLAVLLRNLCKPYNVDSITWDSIALGSTAVLEQIDILQNKNLFRQNYGE